MKFSNLFLDIRIHFECSGNLSRFLTAYPDSKGVWTIGIGTTIYPNGSHVKKGDTCTEEEAILYAHHAMAELEANLGNNLPGLTQAQFDAVGDLCYNIGLGNWAGSTLRKRILLDPQDHDGITAAFLMWDKEKINGELRQSAGLKRRRMCEAYLYCKGENHPTFFE